MDLKLMLPLVGVVLGWMLNSIVRASEARANRKRAVANLLVKLVAVHSKLSLINTSADKLKDLAADSTEYERLRRHVYEKHLGLGSEELTQIRSTIDGVVGISPFLAIELHGYIDVLQKAREASFQQSVRLSPSIYLSLLTFHEVSVELMEERLRRSVLFLSLRHSPTTFVRACVMFFRKSRNKKAMSNSEALNSMIEKAKADLNTLEQHEESAPENNVE